MPRVKFLLNLGNRDAQALGLDPARAREGASLDVAQPVADELLKRGWATDRDDSQPAPEARPVNSAAPRPGEAQPSPLSSAAPGEGEGDEAPDLDSLTKAQLQQYAADNGIDGVADNMTKADMIAAIELAEGR